ncbi:MAG: SDR family NAD(P)-dependent oxidoreductase, partial [Gluconacetobacter diazotrophicus]|nr:SDR family NAD(P)-dependent oxidoreductase [Gluconacetobacter diazotrophicus]
MSQHQEDRRTIVVTGGSRGIGRAICLRLAADGHRVAVNYTAGADAAEAVVARIREAGGEAASIQADMADPEAISRLFADAEQRLGPLGGLVTNAGILGAKNRVDSQTPDDLRHLFAVNVIGPMLCAGEAVRRLSTRHGGPGGAIVLVSSVAA